MLHYKTTQRLLYFFSYIVVPKRPHKLSYDLILAKNTGTLLGESIQWTLNTSLLHQQEKISLLHSMASMRNKQTFQSVPVAMFECTMDHSCSVILSSVLPGFMDIRGAQLMLSSK